MSLTSFLRGSSELFITMILAVASANSQDAATMASQQAAQQAAEANQRANETIHEANEQAMQDAQRANEQTMRNMQDASTNNVPVIAYTDAPSFSVKPGVVGAGTVVHLKSRTHYAVIYYTTNGWTPTTASKRYMGPISIANTTELQAIAVAPNLATSPVVSAKYVVAGVPAKPEPPSALMTDGVLKAGTRLHLVTASITSSKTAKIGDHLKLELNQDVKVGDDVVLPKGTPVEAVITQADSSGHLGMPGDLVFEVKSLNLRGLQIPLKGGETLEGANHYGRAKGIFFVPVVGLAGLAVHGDDAEIKPGMTLTASVENDTQLRP